MKSSPARKWTAKWIGYPDATLDLLRRVALPAPLFRRDFELTASLSQPILYACGLGYFVVFLDGKRITDNRLQPAPTQYDLRWRYRKFQLGELKAGRHTLCLLVGNGNYHHVADDDWNFRYAAWQDYPKMICELTNGEDGEVVVKSDPNWCVCSSAIIYDTLRGGETYDARRELALTGEPPKATHAAVNEYWPRACDKLEQRWEYAAIKPPPGGIGEEEAFPPCRIVAEYPMTPLADNANIWKAPVNLSGVVEVKVAGDAGAALELVHGERLTPAGDALDIKDVERPIHDDTFQKDKYILKGGGIETWHPEFTYHGFQYASVKTKGRVEILSMTALQIHTDFAKRGMITHGPQLFRTMEEAAIRACLSNFVGIPTDCPSREKNGWTSENRIMLETLLYTHDVKDAYLAYMDMVADTQRPSGQIAAMAPTAGFGYNVASGPTQSSALVMIPYTLYQFTGDDDCLQRFYPQMLKYADFTQGVVDDDGRYCSGLTEWLPPADCFLGIPEYFISTAFYLETLRLLAEIAGILGDEQSELSGRYQEGRRKFLDHYYLGDGRFRGERSVISALALNFNLVPTEGREHCARVLNDILVSRKCRVDYGTAGSASVIRALFENGYPDTAFRIMTQPEYPGYTYWLDNLHLTTFPETWEANNHSMNHGAFSDIIACLYRYLAGFRPNAADMKDNTLEICPVAPDALDEFGAEYNGYAVHWKRQKDGIVTEIAVPPGKKARFNGKTMTAGKYTL